MIKRLIIILIFIPISIASFAQTANTKNAVDLKEVTVTARRALSDIGIQKTELDSTVLRESITNSLADVLSQNSTIFIKSYGRGSLSTASFRGTSPSHTQVMWNGIKLNSPMLGMVDFSLIPSYFIDDANIYHGASSTGITGGGLGGAISLATNPDKENGLGMRYVQGISSYKTYDQFARLIYGRNKWHSSTRFLYSSSDNNFKYTNYDVKVPIRDKDNKVVDWIYPKERNKNGQFNDLHLMQELYYDASPNTRWGMYAWYMNSRRGIPKLSVDRKENNRSKNEQDEKTLRVGGSWNHHNKKLSLSGRIGYTYTDMDYSYVGGLGNGVVVDLIKSRSFVNTYMGKFDIQYFLNDKWLLTGSLEGDQNFVRSYDRAAKKKADDPIIGYDKGRVEASAFGSVKYTPNKRLGFALNMREEFYGDKFAPIIPGLFADYLLSRKGNIILKTSFARNYHYPSLNDLYFKPGGNSSLKAEKGYTYDGGIGSSLNNKRFNMKGEVTGYNSYIRDWIVWLPTPQGYWTPANVKEVHSYGLEVKGKIGLRFSNDLKVGADFNYALTRSMNEDDPKNWADNAVGKQLVYIPEHSSSFVGFLSWRNWTFTYKWNYYSERYTTSSNEKTSKLDRLEPYYMNDLMLEKQLNFKWADCSIKIVVNNLFDEEYQSVLSHPMPGRNYGFYLAFKPKFLR